MTGLTGWQRTVLVPVVADVVSRRWRRGFRVFCSSATLSFSVLLGGAPCVYVTRDAGLWIVFHFSLGGSTSSSHTTLASPVDAVRRVIKIFDEVDLWVQ